LPVELLDYPKAALRMVVATQEERRMRIRACVKEPDTVRWIETFDVGDVFYDVGANVGSYSLVAAQNGARVYSFEPEAMNYGRLIQNIGLNPDIEDRITPICSALWDKQELLTMYMKGSVPGLADHAFELNGQGPDVFTQPVLSVTMDELHNLDIPMPNHIKIDVDGYEDRVLGGAWFCLDSPVLKSVMCEMDKAHQDVADNAHDRLTEAGLGKVGEAQLGSSKRHNFFYEKRL